MQEKTYFFYFTHLFLQNTHISLFILHIYSIKYLFFLHFFIISFPLLLSGTLSQTQHKPKITHTHQPTHPPTHPPPSTHNHQPPSPHRKSKQKFQTPQKIQTEIPNPTKNPNSKSKPHKKSRHLNPIINDSHCLDPQRHWSSRPRPHTKTPWHQRRRRSCPGSNKLRPPCPINSLSPSPFPNGLLDQRGRSVFPTHSPIGLSPWLTRSPPSYHCLCLRSLRFWRRRRS